MDGVLYMCKVQFRQDLLYPARTYHGCGTHELMIFTAKMGSCVSIVWCSIIHQPGVDTSLLKAWNQFPQTSLALNIDLAPKRNPGLWVRIKRNGHAGRKLPPAHMSISQHCERKSTLLLGKSSRKTVWWPWMQLSNIFITFMCRFCAFSQRALLVFVHQVHQTTWRTKPLLTSTWPESFRENWSVA